MLAALVSLQEQSEVTAAQTSLTVPRLLETDLCSGSATVGAAVVYQGAV